MRLTERDSRLLRDMALSHVLSRDQIIALDYFSSVTRANTRIRELRKRGFVHVLETPFYNQHLYIVGKSASPVIGHRIATLIVDRAGSPRFLQHALCTTNVRIELLRRGASAWRFEQQLRATFSYANREFAVRPDGLAVLDGRLIAVETDLGHVASAKFKEKLRAYETFVISGECQRLWRTASFTLLTVTTGKLRANRITRLLPTGSAFAMDVQTFDQLGASLVGQWS